MKQHHKIDYVEFPAADTASVKAFYAKAFGWSFIDYGPDYAGLEGAGLDGGFQAQDAATKPLVILHSDDLEASQLAVEAAGGVITQPIFAFPGGRRFHFTDPSGNELGVWSEG